MSKYSQLSSDEIESKIESGNFKRDELVIRDNDSGQIVRLEKTSKHKSNLFPNSFIQVNNNFIYQYDIKKLFSEIKDYKLECDFNDLEIEYNTLLDFIEMHEEIDDFTSDIFTLTVKLTRRFESKVSELVKELNLEVDGTVDKLINCIKAYVNVIFSYSVFLIIKNNSNDKVRSVIDKKILSLRNFITPLYKDLLMPMKSEWCQTKRGNILVPDLNMSLYIQHYTTSDFTLKNIEFLVDFDDRYDSAIDVFDLCKCSGFPLEKKEENRLYRRRSSEKRDNKKHLAYELYSIFVDLTKIEGFINEVDELDFSNKELKEKIFSRL